MSTRVGYGLIGCGSFGRFCLEEYALMTDLACLAVADAFPELARTTASLFAVDFCQDSMDLLNRPEIDIVHLATPPGTHAALALAAMEAGKHVLCEKPLALTMDHARKMIDLAGKKGRVLAVNLIMRYNPLCAGVKRLVERELLGKPLYATLMNAAQDETLGEDHWFWDRSQSGGIFIEHGVHFFDLFEWWFGPGQVVGAHQLIRPGTDFVDQVQCSVRYGELTLGTFYHGFHQMLKRDQQHWRIVFETGTLTMTEWVPTLLEIDFHGSEETIAELEAIFDTPTIAVVDRSLDPRAEARSRHRPRRADLRARFTAEAGQPKMELYGTMLRSLMADQIAAIRNPRHHRLVTEANGLSSLQYAVDAQARAEQS